MGSRIARGENLRCKVTIRNFDKELVNATAIILTITDPKGTVAASKTMIEIVHESLGIYYYSFKPSETAVTGIYTALWAVTYSSEHRKSRGYFEVTE